MKLLILNGPNLNLIGKREPEIYGNLSFTESIEKWKLDFPVDFLYLQSNLEGELINALQQFKGDGIIFNAGGYSHTSVAIRDAVAAIEIPVVEVHLSNLTKRETFRHESLLSPVCCGCIFGFGMKSYDLAIRYFLADEG